MLVTINTDASYRHDLKVGAFAFWMVCNAGRHYASGALKGTIQNCHEAELKAIVNALVFLKEKSGWQGISKIIVNTDSLACINMIAGGKTHDGAHAAKKTYNRLQQELGVPIELRKVAAHSGKDEKRKWVNDWCDKSAKKALKSFIKKQ